MRTRHAPLSRRTSRGRPDSNRFALPGACTRSRMKTWRGRFESTLRNAGSTEQDPGGWTGRPTASVRNRFAAAATLGACSAAAATASSSSSVPGSRAANQSGSRLKVVWLWGQYQRAIRPARGLARIRCRDARTRIRRAGDSDKEHVRPVGDALPAIQQLARTAAVERSTVPSGKPCGS